MSNYAKYKDLGEKSSDSFNKPSSQNISTDNHVRNNVIREPFNQVPQQNQESQAPIIEVSTIDEKKYHIVNNKVCVVYIYGDFCNPCKQIAPRYNQLMNNYNNPGICMLLKENVENGLSNCKGVPTFQFFKDGKYLNTDIIGADILSVDKRIQELLSS